MGLGFRFGVHELLMQSPDGKFPKFVILRVPIVGFLLEHGLAQCDF